MYKSTVQPKKRFFCAEPRRGYIPLRIHLAEVHRKGIAKVVNLTDNLCGETLAMYILLDPASNILSYLILSYPRQCMSESPFSFPSLSHGYTAFKGCFWRKKGFVRLNFLCFYK